MHLRGRVGVVVPCDEKTVLAKLGFSQIAVKFDRACAVMFDHIPNLKSGETHTCVLCGMQWQNGQTTVGYVARGPGHTDHCLAIPPFRCALRLAVVGLQWRKVM